MEMNIYIYIFIQICILLRGTFVLFYHKILISILILSYILYKKES